MDRPVQDCRKPGRPPNNATSAGLLCRDLPPVFRNGNYSCLLCRELLPDCCGKSYSRPDVSMTAVLPTVSVAEGFALASQ